MTQLEMQTESLERAENGALSTANYAAIVHGTLWLWEFPPRTSPRLRERLHLPRLASERPQRQERPARRQDPDRDRHRGKRDAREEGSHAQVYDRISHLADRTRQRTP